MTSKHSFDDFKELGFEVIESDRKSSLTFDIAHNRFYFSTDMFKLYGMERGKRVTLAFNFNERQLLIDCEGRTFNIDKRGYLTSTKFTEQLKSRLGLQADAKLKYAVNDDMTDERFIVLDDITE